MRRSGPNLPATEYAVRCTVVGATRACTINNLLQMRVHRIDPAYVRQLALAGLSYRNLKVDQLVSMRIHRVTPVFVRDMAAADYKRLTPEQLVALRIHGVDPNDARRANAALRRGN